MTCIVGLEHDGRVWLGGDSLIAVNGVTASTATPKVFWLAGSTTIVVGVAGFPRLIDLLSLVPMNPPYGERFDDPREMMVRTFVPALRGLLSDAGALKSSEGLEAMDDTAILVGVRGCLFTVDAALQVSRTAEGYDAIGSGAEIALGALWSMRRSRRHPEEIVRRSLMASATHCAFVRPPFAVLATEP